MKVRLLRRLRRRADKEYKVKEIGYFFHIINSYEFSCEVWSHREEAIKHCNRYKRRFILNEIRKIRRLEDDKS